MQARLRLGSGPAVARSEYHCRVAPVATRNYGPAARSHRSHSASNPPELSNAQRNAGLSNVPLYRAGIE
eukprot:5690775-Prymnesium_polylepis.1